MLDNIMGWMSKSDMDALETLAKLVPDNGVIVEVGSMFGKSACAWATHGAASRIYCIDTFIENYNVQHNISNAQCLRSKFPLSNVQYNILEIFTDNTEKFKNIIPIRGYSPHNIKFEETEIDLFFLDASHTNPNDWENIEYFLPKIKKGGIISGHDYDPGEFPDVVDNVKRLESILGSTAIIYKNSSVWSMVV
jgi:predicted O-methyltransferase YrrM